MRIKHLPQNDPNTRVRPERKTRKPFRRLVNRWRCERKSFQDFRQGPLRYLSPEAFANAVPCAERKWDEQTAGEVAHRPPTRGKKSERLGEMARGSMQRPRRDKENG